MSQQLQLEKANAHLSQGKTNQSFLDYSQIFKSKEEFLFVFGGFNTGGFIDSVEVLDVKRGIWRIFSGVIKGKT